MDLPLLIREAFTERGAAVGMGFRLKLPKPPVRIELPEGTELVGPMGFVGVRIDGLDVTPDGIRVVVNGLPDVRLPL